MESYAVGSQITAQPLHHQRTGLGHDAHAG